MERKAIVPDFDSIPREFHTLIKGATVYDSSCSNEARVLFIDKDGGYYLKSASAGSLKSEAEMTRWFAARGLAAQVIDYVSGDADWFLTRCVPGEDCIHPLYLAQPQRLCDTLAEILVRLHDTDSFACPAPDRTVEYIASARSGWEAGLFHATRLPGGSGISSADEAWRLIEENAPYLKTDTLIHGDYCLPNIILDKWQLGGLIDLGQSGVGDRHIDLYWCLWSLHYNLKTDKYTDRFLDAYGRGRFEPEMLRVIAAFEAFA